MEDLRIGRLLESDFDGIIKAAGGRRFSDDESREASPNCDYLLCGAVIELKIVEEEGLEKSDRQEKLAALFSPSQADRPTVILDPALLDPDAQRIYYNLMATPIKTHVKKAAKQLEKSASVAGPASPRVLILINGGYGALSHDEFRDIAFKRCINDTQKIDLLIIGGCYFYSDTFDSIAIFPFEEISLNLDRTFQGFLKLQMAWNEFVNNFMTAAILGYEDRSADRMPVVDFEYDVGGIRYVKPAPRMGDKSEFFPRGRPRKNSTGIKTCPRVAHTFPKMTLFSWEALKRCIQDPRHFQDTYAAWLQFQTEEGTAHSQPLQPFVPVSVQYEGFCAWIGENAFPATFQTLCDYANTEFDRRLRVLLDQAICYDENSLYLPEAILLVMEEIGQDIANDYGKVVRVTNVKGDERHELLLEDQRFFHEHGLAIAGAYALKLDIPVLLFIRSRKYVWK